MPFSNEAINFIRHCFVLDYTKRSGAAAMLVAANGERILHPISGQHIVWRKMGKGPPLVLLHGGLGSWLHWAHVMPELAASYTLWMPDMPGFGETTLNPTPEGGLDELT